MRPRHLALAATVSMCVCLAVPVLPAQRGAGPDGGGPVAGVGRQGGAARGLLRGRGELPTGTASIRGRVTSDTGSPVRRAQVRASAGGGPGARLASTDAEGRFELRDLPAGQWTISASKPGFVTQRFGQRRAYETVTPVELADGQRLDGVNFSLARGGAITGRVLDDFGDPVANARVQVLRSQIVNGRRRLTPVAGSDDSDDTGAFRLYGLAPGEYYVSAVLRANPIESSSGDQTAYAPTYYPGTGNVAEAQRIALGVGEETSVSFALQPVRTVRVSGSVVSAGGGPLQGGIVALASADADASAVDLTSGSRIAADGTFTIVNVVPGPYVLNVTSGRGMLAALAGRGGLRATAGAAEEPEVASLPLTVGTDDVTGVVVPTTRGASVEGTVVFDGSATRPAASGLQITARPLRATPGAGGRNARVAQDGSFRLTSLIGPHSLRVDGLPQQWMLKSITLNGSEVADTPIDFRGAEAITSARVVLTDRITEVAGTVTLRAQLAVNFSVVVFADEPARWTFPTRYVRSARGNLQGGFTIRGLPAGVRYLAVAVDHLEDGEFQDPVFLQQMRDEATSVSLREGETKTLDLKLVER